MVDVGGQAPSRGGPRTRCRVVVLPPALAALCSREARSRRRRGPIFQAAILAGIMGAKRTSELIPLCHPLPLDDCKVEIEARPPAPTARLEVEVHCRARTRARTGVEMEALTGARSRRSRSTTWARPSPTGS
jgi:cyclic pyranopterin monophosphate synthase